MKRALTIIIIIYAFCSCSNSDSKTITFGTFNIEWLGDGINDKKPRTSEDYKNIAYVIKETGADLLALQEIENEAALEKIMEHLPEYKYFLSEANGDQNLACIFKSDKNFRIEKIGDYNPLYFDSRLKNGFVVQLKIGKTIIPVLILHLKATSSRLYTEKENNESRSLRYRQAIVVKNWADSVINKAKHRELIILGDFNDHIKPLQDSANTLLPLSGNKNLLFLTNGMYSCKFKNWSVIDHIVISKALKKKVNNNTTRIFDFNMILKDKEASNISDHCPVLTELLLE